MRTTQTKNKQKKKRIMNLNKNRYNDIKQYIILVIIIIKSDIILIELFHKLY